MTDTPDVCMTCILAVLLITNLVQETAKRVGFHLLQVSIFHCKLVEYKPEHIVKVFVLAQVEYPPSSGEL